MKNIITNIDAIEILDSRGVPTLKTYLEIDNKYKGSASVPSGASTGEKEAYELRDNDSKRFNGKGVLRAVNNVKTIIYDALVSKNIASQQNLDNLLISLDGTRNKSNLGANSILSVSLAFSRAMANKENISLYEYYQKISGTRSVKSFPVPMCNIINGGSHADNNIDIQEFMVVPIGASSFSEAIRWVSEVFSTLKSTMRKKGLSVNVGDEGGIAPNLQDTNCALDSILDAIIKSNYIPGKDISIALDVAANEWYLGEGNYTMPKSNLNFSRKELIKYYSKLLDKYPIISIEDPFSENDHESWKEFNALKIVSNLVGDDLYATNSLIFERHINDKLTSSILIKPNQIGTITEMFNTINLARLHDHKIIISHRSGETEDNYIADIALGVGAEFIKAGAPSRSDRTSKYNRLLEIEYLK